MENNEIINRLMSETSTSSPLESDDEVSISDARVVSIRYKIYVIVLLFLLLFGVLDYLLPTWDKWMSLRDTSTNKEFQITSFDQKKLQYDQDKALITKIESNENAIVACLNYKQGCKDLDQDLKNNFSFVRSYLQLNNLYDPKMEINEKILLTNINEYLLKTIVSTGGQQSKTRNGTVNSISFGEPKVVVSQLYSIPVRLSATFETKDELLAFIENVDKNILENKAYRILYKIDEIGYDIMNYDKEQTVDIRMHAFYYKE